MFEIEPRFVFAGHAIGAAAHFHRLDKLQGLNHVVPTLAASVLPVTGGLSKSHQSNFCFTVDEPRRRHLISIRHTESTAEGRPLGETGGVTEVNTVVEGAGVVEKLHVDRVKLHMTSTRKDGQKVSTILSKDNAIEGLRLGNVKVKVVLDEEPFATCGTKDALGAFFSKQRSGWKKANHWRFNTHEEAEEIEEHKGRFICTIVKKITLTGPKAELAKMEVKGYTIHWDGFGKIILGEMLIRDQDRRLTMIRLKMGSDAGGMAVLADGHSNGVTFP